MGHMPQALPGGSDTRNWTQCANLEVQREQDGLISNMDIHPGQFSQGHKDSRSILGSQPHSQTLRSGEEIWEFMTD